MVGLLVVILTYLNLQCVLPAGVEFYASGYDSNDSATFPRSYPIVLTGMQELFYSIMHIYVCAS